METQVNKVWRSVEFTAYLMDWEDSEFNQKLHSFGVKITTIPHTYPTNKIEFFDENDRVMNYLKDLDKQGRIKILNIDQSHTRRKAKVFKGSKLKTQRKEPTKGFIPWLRKILRI